MPVWITAVDVLEAQNWITSQSLVGDVAASAPAVYSWNSDSLNDPSQAQLIASMGALQQPVQVNPGQSIQVGVSGLLQAPDQEAKVSQLKISYTPNNQSTMVSTVVGGPEVRWNPSGCNLPFLDAARAAQSTKEWIGRPLASFKR